MPDRLLGSDDLAALPDVPPARRYRYGAHAAQVADLHLPASHGPHPVALLLHGGCWRNRFDRRYLGQAARDLAAAGIACWNVEYRCLGDGGGWPATFADAAAAADLLRDAAQDAPLDLGRVVAVGHSAGGHLALWLAARVHLPTGAPGAARRPLALRGVLSLAGIPDLAEAERRGICRGAPAELLGGLPEERPERYARASPAELPPARAPQRHLVGARDDIVPPEYVAGCVERARARGEPAELLVLPDCGHFEPVVAGSTAWPSVKEAITALLGPDDGTAAPEPADTRASREAPSS